MVNNSTNINKTNNHLSPQIMYISGSFYVLVIKRDVLEQTLWKPSTAGSSLICYTTSVDISITESLQYKPIREDHQLV